MKIYFASILNAGASVTYKRVGTDLEINGTAIDLSGTWAILEPDSEGEPLETSGNLRAGKQEGGEIVLTVLAPHGPRASEAERFPDPVTLEDGESISFPGGVKS